MADHPGGEGGRTGLFVALKNLTATLLAIGKTRAELLVSEVEAEKLRLMSLWAKAISAAFLLALGLIMAVFSVALAFWDQRVLVFGLFALLFIGGGLILVVILKNQASQPSKLFSSSLAELDADMTQLRAQGKSAHE